VADIFNDVKESFFQRLSSVDQTNQGLSCFFNPILDKTPWLQPWAANRHFVIYLPGLFYRQFGKLVLLFQGESESVPGIVPKRKFLSLINSTALAVGLSYLAADFKESSAILYAPFPMWPLNPISV